MPTAMVLRFTVYGLRLFDLDAAPEGNATLDFFGCGFRLGIIPGCILIDVSLNNDIVITCLALPGTNAMRAAFLKVLTIDGFRRKVMIAFNDNRLIALGEHGVIPNCFHAFMVKGKLRLVNER